MSVLGIQIKKYRTAKGITQEQLGQLVGVTTQAVSKWERGGVPDAELLAGLQAELQEKREIAVDVEVRAPTVQSVDVTVAVAPENGMAFAEVQAAVEQSMATFFTGRLLGKAVRLAELGSRLYALDCVENYRFSAPTEDLAADDTVLPVLGTLTVTEMEA